MTKPSKISISLHESDQVRPCYEIFVSNDKAFSKLSGIEVDDIPDTNIPRYILAYYDPATKKLDPSYGYVPDSDEGRTEIAIFNEFEAVAQKKIAEMQKCAA